MDIGPAALIRASLSPLTVPSLFFFVFLILNLFRRTLLPTFSGFSDAALPAFIFLLSFLNLSPLLLYPSSLLIIPSPFLFFPPPLVLLFIPPSLCSPPRCSNVPDFVILSSFLQSLQFVIH